MVLDAHQIQAEIVRIVRQPKRLRHLVGRGGQEHTELEFVTVIGHDCVTALDGDLGWTLGVIFRAYVKSTGAPGHAEAHVLAGLSKTVQRALKSLLRRLAAHANALDPVASACEAVDDIITSKHAT